MEKVVIDAEVRAKLNGLNRELALTDSVGKTIGFFVPPQDYYRMVLAQMSCEPTPEELEAGRKEYRETGGWTTAQVLAHLAEIEREWKDRQG